MVTNAKRHPLFFSVLGSVVVAMNGFMTTAAAKPLTTEGIFDSSRLLEIKITMPPADWDRLRKQQRGGGGFSAIFSDTSAKPFTYFKGDVTVNGVQVANVGIRKKGFIGSLDDVRPSLKIKFDEYESQAPVVGLDRLTLNNNKQDTSLVSQFLAYKVFTDAGIHAPRCSFASVTVNGDHLGVYSNVESYKKPFLESRFGDASGNLYEGTLADFYTKAIGRLENKTETAPREDEMVMRLANMLTEERELTLDEVATVVDVDNFLRFWAVESLLGFWDGYTQNQNNYFVYANPSNDRFYFMPWGADSCFTNSGGPFARFNGGSGSTSVKAESMLSNRLFHIDGVASRYKEVMLEVLRDAWNEDELVAEVDRIEQLLSGKVPESQASNGRSSFFGRRGLTMSGVRSFIKSRRQEILDELADWPVDLPASPRRPMYTVEIGMVKGSFETSWSESQAAGQGSSVSSLQLKLDGKEFTLADATVKAQPMQFGFGRGGRGGRPSAAMISIQGKRPSDDETVSLMLMTSRNAFEELRDGPISVSGSLSLGRNSGFGFGRSGKALTGELKLSKTGTTTGAAVVGSIDLSVIEIHGGMMDRGRR